MTDHSLGALAGITVLDFSTLLPGPMASLMLAACGARIIKVERAPAGDEMRSYQPSADGVAIEFAMLNRGKESLALDLKKPEARAAILELIPDVDVVLEQFRPGVMERLGLGADTLLRRNPALIYCAIRGYGPGPNRDRAGHDLSYMADAGLLELSEPSGGRPVVPPVLIADIAGGTLPAVMNISLALLQRERTGRGSILELAIADNLRMFGHRGLSHYYAGQELPHRGKDLLNGGTPRYHIYKTKDGRALAVAALENRFWKTFCEAANVPMSASISDVATAIELHDFAHWSEVFDKVDCCVRPVLDFREALASMGTTTEARKHPPSLPLPLAETLQRSSELPSAPGLGRDNPAFRHVTMRTSGSAEDVG